MVVIRIIVKLALTLAPIPFLIRNQSSVEQGNQRIDQQNRHGRNHLFVGVVWNLQPGHHTLLRGSGTRFVSISIYYQSIGNSVNQLLIPVELDYHGGGNLWSMTMRNLIKPFLDSRDVSVYRFWQDTGISRTTAYALYNNPEQYPGRDVMDAICSVYKVQPGDLLQWVADDSPPASG